MTTGEQSIGELFGEDFSTPRDTKWPLGAVAVCAAAVSGGLWTLVALLVRTVHFALLS
jgi:hypothetical protein